METYHHISAGKWSPTCFTLCDGLSSAAECQCTPMVSQNLLPIDDVMDEMGRRLRNLPNLPTTLVKMGPALTMI